MIYTIVYYRFLIRVVILYELLNKLAQEYAISNHSGFHGFY